MKYLIWNFEHGLWWAANRNGYAHSVSAAGRYSPFEAVDILCDDVVRRNIPVREEDARDDCWPATSAKRAGASA